MRFTYRTLLRRAFIGAAGVLLAACSRDELLDVEDPDRVVRGSIETVEALPAVRAGAISDFTLSYSGSGGTEGIILQSGLLGDEMYLSGTFPTRLQIDRRDALFNNATNQGIYRNIHRARRATERGADAYARLDPENDIQAELLALAGFTYVFFAENYCGAVPFSELTDAGVEFGEPLSREEILARAIERFDAALAEADAGSRFAYLAQVGKARALLDLGQFAEAAAAVAGVPTTFVYNVEHSANSGFQNNGQWSFSNNQGRFAVANNQGLPYRDAFDSGDVRVPYFVPSGALRAGFDTNILRATQQKYPLLSSNTPLGTGVEARLIEAEAALQAGNTAQWLAIHQALRNDASLTQCPAAAEGCPATANLVPLGTPVTQAERVDVHFRERAYWLFETAHRLGDMRRLIYQYGRNANDVFPTGQYVRPGSGTPSQPVINGNYGDQVALHLGIDELNNPLFAAQYDESGCDVTVP